MKVDLIVRGARMQLELAHMLRMLDDAIRLLS